MTVMQLMFKKCCNKGLETLSFCCIRGERLNVSSHAKLYVT